MERTKKEVNTFNGVYLLYFIIFAIGVQLGLGEQPFSLTLYFRYCKVKREMTHNNTNMHLPKNLKFVGHKVNLAYSDCLE